MERKRKEIITAVVRYAWYLGVCGYCSEAWILFCVVVVSYVGEFVSVGGREGGVFFLWAVGLYGVVKDCIRKYGLVFF